MSKHTPGPWKVEKIPPEHFDLLSIQSDDGSVAVISNRHDKNSEANARLIAAAPLMLVALKAIMPNDECGHPNCVTPDDIKRARAVINKATGTS